MAEVIILSEWKKKKELEELEKLEKDLEGWIDYLGIEQKYYIFDDNYSPIEIKPRSN